MSIRLPQWLTQIDLQDILIGISAVALVTGLALISIPAALIIPSVLLLVLGYLRKWY